MKGEKFSMYPTPISKYLGIIFILLNSPLLFGQLPKTTTAIGLTEVFSNIQTDSLSKLELESSIEFNNLINQYRKNNHLPQLVWDMGLWLSARNHSIYMAATGQFDHGQTNGNSSYFTGNTLPERIKKVVLQNGISNADSTYFPFTKYILRGRNPLEGENIHLLMDPSLSSKLETMKIPALAKSLAKNAFTGWKNSPGHNRNMLRINFKAHGTAFIIYKDRVYVTDDFMGN